MVSVVESVFGIVWSFLYRLCFGVIGGCWVGYGVGIFGFMLLIVVIGLFGVGGWFFFVFIFIGRYMWWVNLGW